MGFIFLVFVYYASRSCNKSKTQKINPILHSLPCVNQYLKFISLLRNGALLSSVFLSAHRVFEHMSAYMKGNFFFTFLTGNLGREGTKFNFFPPFNGGEGAQKGGKSIFSITLLTTKYRFAGKKYLFISYVQRGSLIVGKKTDRCSRCDRHLQS